MDSWKVSILEKLLEKNSWTATINKGEANASFGLKFAEDSATGSRTIYTFFVDEQFLAIKSSNDRYIDERDWSKAVISCNRWNERQSYVFAYVKFYEDGDKADFAVSTGFMPLSKTGSQGEIEHYASLLISFYAHCEQFWKFVHQDEKIAQVKA
jgi:hypothetical protein